MCPAFSDELHSLTKCVLLPQKTDAELAAIRSATKYGELEKVESYNENHRLKFYRLNLVPRELDKLYLRSVRAAGPFRRFFDEGDSNKYTAAALAKQKAWNDELVNEFFSQVNNWYAKRAVAIIGDALATDGDGKFTPQAQEFLDRFLLMLHVMTFERGGRNYIRNGQHHCGKYLASITKTIAELKNEIRSCGGWLAWQKKGCHLKKAYNIYHEPSWLSRARETRIFPGRTAPCILLRSLPDCCIVACCPSMHSHTTT